MSLFGDGYLQTLGTNIGNPIAPTYTVFIYGKVRTEHTKSISFTSFIVIKIPG